MSTKERLNEELQEFSQLMTSGALNVKTRLKGHEDDCDVEGVSKTTSTNDKSMWSVSNGSYFGCSESCRTLPAGIYECHFSANAGPYFSKIKETFDELVDLPDTASQEILDSMTKFWTMEDHFRRHGFLWKRGVLLWGPPGSGKTSTLHKLSRSVSEYGGISLLADNPNVMVECIRLLRQIQPKTPLVILMEDIDSLIDRYGESGYLALLDGETQTDNVMFIATTNYPERLDQRFINRPSRFDMIKKIGMPSSDARRTYLAHKNPRLVHEGCLDQWVSDTEGFSVAHLKELITSVDIFDVPYEETLLRLKTMREISLSSSRDDSFEFGFTASATQKR